VVFLSLFEHMEQKKCNYLNNEHNLLTALVMLGIIKKLSLNGLPMRFLALKSILKLFIKYIIY